MNETSAQRLIPFRFNRRGPGLAVGNFTGTDRDEVVIGGTTRDAPVSFSRARRRCQLVRSMTAPCSYSTPTATATCWWTRGGNSLPAGMPDYQPRFTLATGAADSVRRARAHCRPLPINAAAAVAGDFDHDGRLDVFLGGRLLTGPVSPRPAKRAAGESRRQVRGRHRYRGTRIAGSRMVTAALWSDVDGDGWLDLLVTLRVGERELFPQQPGEGIRGPDGVRRLCCGGHGGGGRHSRRRTSTVTADPTTWPATWD